MFIPGGNVEGGPEFVDEAGIGSVRKEELDHGEMPLPDRLMERRVAVLSALVDGGATTQQGIGYGDVSPDRGDLERTASEGIGAVQSDGFPGEVRNLGCGDAGQGFFKGEGHGMLQSADFQLLSGVLVSEKYNDGILHAPSGEGELTQNGAGIAS